ncbi:MAG: hypothetical protein JW749_11110 [Sedimentisphaerales bacterium]|nr:hypothetical protein [Sedimentisphaerales bacterium]
MAGKSSSFVFSSPKAKRAARKSNVAGIFKGLFFFIFLAAILAGFTFLDGYVKKQTAPAAENRTIEIMGETPFWVSEEIKNRVYAAATADSGSIESNDPRQQLSGAGNTAAIIQRSVQRLVPWLADVKVQTTHNSVQISGRWRKPIAVVTVGSTPSTSSGRTSSPQAGKNKFFLDSDLVVLDYIPVGDLPVVCVSGLEFDKHPPAAGEICQGEDLAAALSVLSRLERMDAAICPDTPLLRLIDRIDVSNFDGRKQKKEPHIVLYTKDDVQIIWGAEIGAWQRHLESPDDDKLAKLYTYYQQNKTLTGVKYINLRDPRQTIYLPIDKY